MGRWCCYYCGWSCRYRQCRNCRRTSCTTSRRKSINSIANILPTKLWFSGAVQKITLEAGTLIQRTGDLVGRYIAPAGTPTQMLSLPYDKIGQPTTSLQVQQSIEVLSGRVAPWFGQIGGGIQYQLRTPLDQLISEGIIKIFGG